MRHVKLVGAFLLACLATGAWVVPAAANGLPTPFPGVAQGPDGTTLQQIAEGYGLVCKEFAGGVAPEVACNNAAAGAALTLSVIFYTSPALVMVATATGPDPLPSKVQTFMGDLTRPFCEPTTVEPFFASVANEGTPPEGKHFLAPAACEIWASANAVGGRAFWQVSAYAGNALAVATALPVPTALPLPSSIAISTTTPVASVAPVPGPLVAPTPGAFAGSIAKPADVHFDAAALVQGLAVALLALFLIPFPAQLFNSTLEENHDEVRGWFRWIRLPSSLRGGADLWRSPIGIALFIAIASVLYALLDPGLGLDVASAAEVGGFAIGIVVTTAIFSIPSVLAHRRLGDAWSVRVLPVTLLIGAGCVLVSRLTSFEPGYVYGVLLGLTFGRDLGHSGEGRSVSLAAVTMVAVALVAWVLLGIVGDPGDLIGIAIRTALASTMVAGLEGAALGLLPLRFQPGERVWAWNRFAWGAIFGTAMFLFVLILVNPASGYLADSSKTPLVTIVALLIAFGGVSIAFWAYFRFRPSRPRSEPQG